MPDILRLLQKVKRRMFDSGRRLQWPEFTDEEFLSLRSTFLESGSWGGGDEVEAFCREFTSYLGVKHGVLVNSGTSALEIAVAACGIKAGDEVIVPSYTFYSSASCIAKAGAKPVFVDVRLEDACIDPNAVRAAITPLTRALVVVHFGGNPADMETLMSICKEHNLILIEDAAHATGSKWNGKQLGSIADIGCFSFHASKPLAAGEGGFLATNNGDLFEKTQALADFGILPGRPRYEHSILGSNVRISKFQAAILSLQLKKLDAQIARREQNVKVLEEALKDIQGIRPWTRMPYATRLNHYIFGFYYERDCFANLSKPEFAGALKSKGIYCLEGYDRPLYAQPVFTSMYPELVESGIRHENSLQLCQSLVGLSQGFLLSKSKNMVALANALKQLQTRGAN